MCVCVCVCTQHRGRLTQVARTLSFKGSSAGGRWFGGVCSDTEGKNHFLLRYNKDTNADLICKPVFCRDSCISVARKITEITEKGQN